MSLVEEGESQLVRNMRSIGLNLQPWVDQDLLHYHAVRPTLYGLDSLGGLGVAYALEGPPEKYGLPAKPSIPMSIFLWKDVIKPLGIRVTRIASGLPVGGDLEYADEVTLGRALEGRA